MEKSLFTSKELDTLVEALESWETKNSAGRLMSSLMGAMLTKDTPEARAEWEKKQKEEEERDAREQRQRKDVSTLLKAKIIMLRQSAEIGMLVQ